MTQKAVDSLPDFAALWASLVSFIAPEECCSCGSGFHPLCRDCAAALQTPPEWSTLQPGKIPLSSTSADMASILKVLRALKDDLRTSVASPLAAALSVPLTAALTKFPHVDAITVVPSRASAWRKRGFHPVALLLRKLGVRPVKTIRALRQWSDQRELTVDERRANLDHAFVAPSTCVGKTFILVDDVITSGATVNEAVRAIEQGGGEVVCVVALRRIPLRRHAEEKLVDDILGTQA